MANSFGSQSTLKVGDRSYTIHRPYSLKTPLKTLLRPETGRPATPAAVEARAKWPPIAEPSREIAFPPSRVLPQDFTGVPCVVALAAMRDALTRLGGDPNRIN